MTALDTGTGSRILRIPWRRKSRLAKRGHRRRTSWSRRIPVTITTICRRMIPMNTTTTSGRQLPASTAKSTPTTMSACPCSRRRIISSQVPRYRQRKSVHPAGDAKAASSRVCRCSSLARRWRHPARAPPVSNPVLLS